MSQSSDETVFSTRLEAELSTVPDIDGWPDLSTRLQTASRRPRPWVPGLGPIRSRRLLAGVVAGILIALIGSASAFAAASGLLDDWMRSVGLGAASAPRPVSVSTTHGGITIKATEAYRDSYVIALALKIDDPAAAAERDWLLAGPPPTMVTSAGTELRLVTFHPQGRSPRTWLVVFADRTAEQIHGNAVTLTIPQVTRYVDPLHSKEYTDISGPWTLHLDLRGSGSPVRPLPAPAAGQAGQVTVTYHDVAISGPYLAVHLDLAEAAPGAVVHPPSEESPGLMTTFDLYGPDGKRLEPVAWVFDDPGKGDSKPSATPRTYHWGYLFAAGTGTYRLVVHSGGQAMERSLQVR